MPIKKTIDHSPSSGTFIIIDEPLGEFLKIKQHNQQRFLNYCHKGTVLEQATSKVKWEVVEVYENRTDDVFTGSAWGIEIPNKFVKMRSLNGGKNTGKRYTKNVPIDKFYMYDIVAVADAVKVLWGDPKDNPPKKPGDKL